MQRSMPAQKKKLQKRLLPVLLWQNIIRSTLQSGRGEPVNTPHLHSKDEKMGVLGIVDLGVLREGIDNPHLRDVILIIRF